jgi:hypothetical protein
MRTLDARLAQSGAGVSEVLDCAVIDFLNQYRVCFVGETTPGRLFSI